MVLNRHYFYTRPLPVIMKKTILLILITFLTCTISSCKKELETILETDYKVIELDYGFDNYINNTRDKSEQLIIKERNLVIIEVDKNGSIKFENNSINDSLLVTEIKKYIIPNPDNDEMPITIEKEFQYSGKVDVNKNIIILASFNGELNYRTYNQIRNKVYLAFNEVRDEFSKGKFGKSAEELSSSENENDNAKWNELRQIFPIRYTEITAEK